MKNTQQVSCKDVKLDLITFLLRLFLYVDRKAAYMETRDWDLIDLIYFEGTLSFRARMFNRDTHIYDSDEFLRRIQT